MLKIINFFFYLLWSIAFLVFIYFAYKFYSDIDLAAPFGILLFALLASTAVLKTISKNEEINIQKERYDKSKFYMKRSIEGFDEVYNLLKDLNNNRVIWMQAARLLSSAIQKCTNMQCKSAPLSNTYLLEISNNPASLFCFNL